jgi:enamine deaminase RidA (YjgF/YER057c/UK114 family)
MLQKIQPIAKAIVAIGGAVVITASVVATGHIDANGIVDIVTAWIAAIGVYHVPNKTTTPTPTVTTTSTAL